MTAVIPMAGRGSRYVNHGYETPKPLISVAGKPMILWALESLKKFNISNYVFVLLGEHDERFNIQEMIKQNITGNVSFKLLDRVTQGQLCTVLEAREFINNNEDVLVASSDTLVLGDLYADVQNQMWDGLISVINLPGDQWSFAKTNDKGEVTMVTEKVRISDNASTGQYYFRRGKDLVATGEDMIANNELTRGEYYVIPVYQKLINAGHKIGISTATEMWDLGTPDAKAYFESNYKF